MAQTETATTEAAPWKQRFRVANVRWTQLAEERLERGLAVSNRSGRYQLHAWDVPTGELRQLTDRPEGVVSGFIAPDGRHIYHLDDAGGNEVGHLVRVPFEGGEPEDVTPQMPPYASFGGAVSATGNLLAFTLADADGFAVVAVDLGPSGELGEPRFLFRSERLVWLPVISPEGDLVVVASAERSELQHYSLLAFEARSGERVAELWDGPEASVGTGPFARRRAGGGDVGVSRLAGTTDRTGVDRALGLHCRTG